MYPPICIKSFVVTGYKYSLQINLCIRVFSEVCLVLLLYPNLPPIKSAEFMKYLLSTGKGGRGQELLAAIQVHVSLAPGGWWFRSKQLSSTAKMCAPWQYKSNRSGSITNGKSNFLGRAAGASPIYRIIYKAHNITNNKNPSLLLPGQGVQSMDWAPLQGVDARGFTWQHLEPWRAVHMARRARCSWSCPLGEVGSKLVTGSLYCQLLLCRLQLCRLQLKHLGCS